MKKLINFLIVCLFICLLSVFNVTSASTKDELPEPVIGLSEEKIYDQNTYTSENQHKDTSDNSIEPRTRRNISSSVNVQRPSNATPVPFDEQQNEDDLFTVLPQKGTLTKEHYDADFGSSDDEFVPGEIIVCFKDECSSSMISKLISDQKVVNAKDIYKPIYDSVVQSSAAVNVIGFKTLKENIEKYYVITIASKTKEDVLKTIEKLNKEPTVKYAEPNYICKPCEIPNDYNNYDLWNMDRIQMPETWDISFGSNIRVGVLDTGIDSTHPDLKDNIDTNLGWNCARKDNVDTMDYDYHGTHVAGIIGARGNNSIGVVGVNPHASLVPIKICFDNQNRNSNMVLMAEGIAYATANNIPVCNLSYSVHENNTFIDAIKKYGESGGTLVISAGNSSKCIDDDPAYTAVSVLDNVILVASSDNGADDKEALSSFSNYGNVVHVAAPGTNIISTVPISRYNGYAALSGTSMAAPHVAGVVSLLKGKNSSMTSEQIRQAIMDGADFVSNLKGKVASNSRLNAKNAMDIAQSYLEVLPKNGETMANAIKRSLGSRTALNIRRIKVYGNAVMADGIDSKDSASAILPNLEYADISDLTEGVKECAFYNCKNLTTIILPEKNVKLPAYCFMNCIKLSTIYRANSLSSIKNEADLTGLISGSKGEFAIQTQCFEGCTSLKTIKLPNTSKIRISQFVFNNCSNLSTIYIDTQIPITGEADLTGLTELDWCTFRGTGISSVKLPKDVNISQEAFANCSRLQSIQVYPAQTEVMTVHTRAFENVNPQCKVYMNEELYGKSMDFKRTTTYSIPKEINTIIARPLENEKMSDMIKYYLDYYGLSASAIKHLVIDESVIMGDSNGSESASILPNLETVDLSSFTGQLGTYAFYNCTKLKTVIRGSGLTYIPGQCFMYCKSLTSIIEADKYPQIWNEADLTDLSGELSINTQGFEKCTNLKTIRFPSSKIGLAGAFPNCPNLSTVYIDGNEKQEGVFDLTGISNLWVGWGHNFKNTGEETVKLPRGVSISEYCFYNCLLLTKIEFERIELYSVGIGSYAFYGVNPLCKAYMDPMLAYNSSFQLKRSDTDNIPKIAYEY